MVWYQKTTVLSCTIWFPNKIAFGLGHITSPWYSQESNPIGLVSELFAQKVEGGTGQVGVDSTCEGFQLGFSRKRLLSITSVTSGCNQLQSCTARSSNVFECFATIVWEWVHACPQAVVLHRNTYCSMCSNCFTPPTNPCPTKPACKLDAERSKNRVRNCALTDAISKPRSQHNRCSTRVLGKSTCDTEKEGAEQVPMLKKLTTGWLD